MHDIDFSLGNMTANIEDLSIKTVLYNGCMEFYHYGYRHIFDLCDNGIGNISYMVSKVVNLVGISHATWRQQVVVAVLFF